jgi:hypothetical protein
MAVAVNRPKRQQQETQGNLFAQMRTVQFGKFFSGWMGYFLLIAVCGLLYIANLHYADRNVRTLNRMRKEVAELRTEYTMLRAQFIMGSKRSIIKTKVNQLGLVENDKPAYKLAADK